MPKKTPAQKKKTRALRALTLTGAQLAQQEVAQLFNAAVIDRGTFNADGDPLPLRRFEEACEQVSDLLEAEHVREYGPIDKLDDGTQQSIHMSAGYLVGVQVGLRLRGVS